jgi:hypothetical protein
MYDIKKLSYINKDNLDKQLKDLLIIIIKKNILIRLINI